MELLGNLDLLSVGVAIAGTIILGFAVFFADRESSTSKIFLLFTLITAIWGTLNYLSYKITNLDLAFWFLRFEIFFAVWHTLLIFQLLYLFPNRKNNLPKKYYRIILSIATLTSFICLTPLVFSSVKETTEDGFIKTLNVGPGMVLFAIFIITFIIAGFYSLARKINVSKSKEENQRLTLFFTGGILMFLPIIVFIFIFPAFLEDSRFIPFAAVFIFPFIAFTSYAILRHKLFNVRAMWAGVLVFLLAIVAFYEVIFAGELILIIFRSGVFLLILVFGILLIKGIIRDVRLRERVQKLAEELKVTNEKLKEADRLKSEFLGFASHQVKSPMNVVKGYAQLIYDGTYGSVSEKVKETAKKIKTSADRLIALVNNLLDLRKIEEGKMEFNFKEVDIVHLVMEMVDEYRIITSEKGLEIKFGSSEQSIKIKADEEKIRQVIQNLIDNSIKYTDQGYIKVSVSEEGQSPKKELQHSNILKNVGMSDAPLTSSAFTLIKVEDTGRGISKELQQKLFSRFVRDEKTKREIQGTGLGLYIAKEIVEAHHGKIWSESEGENKGSRFYVKLPKQ